MTRAEIFKTYGPPNNLTKISTEELREVFLEIDGVENPFSERPYISLLWTQADYQLELNIKKLRLDILMELERRESFSALLYPGCLDIAIKAAFEVGLINSNGKWCYTGAKTNAVSLYWRALVATGLAKAEKPMVSVVDGMGLQFSIDLGKNAINKNKKPEAYKRDEQDLYNNLLMAIDRLKKV